MIFYNLGFIFKDESVLLIESHKFPGKYNGIGGVQGPFDLPRLKMEQDFKREAGIILARPLMVEDQFAILTDNKNYSVNCWRIDANSSVQVMDPEFAENPARSAFLLPIESLMFFRERLAPKVSTLVSLALDAQRDTMACIMEGMPT